MYKLTTKLLIYPASISYIGLIFVMPLNWHCMGSNPEIFPAFDLIIIYYLSTYHTIKNWHLFFLGLIIDQLYQMPLGTSSLSLIIANLFLVRSRSRFLLKEYDTNVTVFCAYSMFIIASRFLMAIIDSTDYYTQGNSIYFYYFTTIFSYPIMKILIGRPAEMIKNYAL